MTYSLRTTQKFDRQLKKLASDVQRQIVGYLLKHVDGAENPRAVGKALTGDRRGFWRYRVGDYRIICSISGNECIVLALAVAHRKDVYR